MISRQSTIEHVVRPGLILVWSTRIVTVLIFIVAMLGAILNIFSAYEVAIAVAAISVSTAFYFSLVSPQRDACPPWVVIAFAFSGVFIAGTAGNNIFVGPRGQFIQIVSYLGLGIVFLFAAYWLAVDIADLPPPRKRLSDYFLGKRRD